MTNKNAKGKKGSLVAIVAGTKADQVIDTSAKLIIKKTAVKEITDQEQNLGRNN